MILSYKKMEKKAQFDKVAGVYDSANFIFRIFYRKILPFINPKPKDKVLDFGCGTGAFTILVATKVKATIIGIDASKKMIEKTISKNAPQNASFIVGNAAKVPFENNTFDIAYSTFAFHHMPKEEVLKEIHKKLKKDGKIIIADVVSNGLIGKILKLTDEFLTDAKVLRKEEIEALISSEGFRNIKTSKIYNYFCVFEAEK